jgi:hypothetical protein
MTRFYRKDTKNTKNYCVRSALFFLYALCVGKNLHGFVSLREPY